jgi:hypothetical protein
LFDPPTEQRELVRHYTLSDTDLAAIARCRGDHNRLGHALMRCYLRYPGRALHVGERPPAALLAFIAEQIKGKRCSATLPDPAWFRVAVLAPNAMSSVHRCDSAASHSPDVSAGR